MYRRYGSGFVLAYFLLSFVYALVDVAKYAFGLLLALAKELFKLAGLGIDYQRRAAFEQIVRNAVAPYLPVLVAKRHKLLRADEYGVADNKRWSKELGYFIGRVLLPNLDGYQAYAHRHIEATAKLVDAIVSEHQPLAPG